jgi:hypothetical protein
MTETKTPYDAGYISYLIHQVCRRPAMYAVRYSWYEATSFICGAWCTLRTLFPELYPQDEARTFSLWLALKFGYARNYGWPRVRDVFPDDETAFARLPSLYAEFRSEYEKQRTDQRSDLK